MLLCPFWKCGPWGSEGWNNVSKLSSHRGEVLEFVARSVWLQNLVLSHYSTLLLFFSISNQYLSGYNLSSLSQCLVEMEQLFSIFHSKPSTFEDGNIILLLPFSYLMHKELRKSGVHIPEIALFLLIGTWCVSVQISLAYRDLAECSTSFLIHPKDLTGLDQVSI